MRYLPDVQEIGHLRLRARFVLVGCEATLYDATSRPGVFGCLNDTTVLYNIHFLLAAVYRPSNLS